MRTNSNNITENNQGTGMKSMANIEDKTKLYLKIAK